MMAASVVQNTVGRVWRKTWDNDVSSRAIDCASQFLVGSGQLHRVSAVALTYPFRRRHRAKFHERECDRSPRVLARVLGGGSSPISGPLAQVARRLRTLSATSVSAALDTHSWFAVCPGSAGRDCWGAVRLHHRCRLLTSTDAAREGIGSFMRLR